MKESEIALLRWDMSVVYPSLESSEFESGFQSTVRQIEELVVLFDQYDVARQEMLPVDSATVQAFENVIDNYNSVLEKTWTLGMYIRCFVDTDSQNELALAKLSEFTQKTRELPIFYARFAAWIASMDVKALMEQSSVAREHAFALQKATTHAEHLLSPTEEVLVAEMSLTGLAAWTSLYNTVVSQLTIPFEIDGKEQVIPMSNLRKLAYDPNRMVRQRAYEAELSAWEHAAIPLVAALNAIKGEQITLAEKRGWPSPLDVTLFENNIDHQILDALMESVHESFQDFRRYLRAKARALHLPTLAWYDLFAPVGESKRTWSYDEARKFIIEQFTDYSPKMGALAKRAFQERWIDSGIRPGKIDVGYCFPLRNDESRILVNYRPIFFDVSYLAHELGHAYHNLNLAKRTSLQRETPLLLHETASTFCQIIVQQAGLQQADTEERIAILDTSLQFLTVLVLETTTWYLFEKDVCEHRVRSELSLELLKQKMLEAQLQVYGDTLEPDMLHPYDWAAWPHLFAFINPYAFYNFQYSFGTLFSSGLYRQYQKDPNLFKASFDELLSSTGMEETADLADRFGFDIRTTDFWRSSLDVIKSDIDQFESLVE